MNQFALAKALQPHLRKGDLTHCESIVLEHLSRYPDSPFQLATRLNFNNNLDDLASSFDTFFAREQKKFEIAAAYVEMNDFSINPDRWYFDLFAYQTYGGHKDYDWLSDWDSDDCDHITLTGMEELQFLYKSENLAKKEVGIISLLIVVRFQQLIKAAIPRMKKKSFPILVTAHDYEFIYEG